MISELWNINHKYANVCQCDMLYRRGMPPSSWMYFVLFCVCINNFDLGTEVTRLRSLQSMPTEPVLLEKPRLLPARDNSIFLIYWSACFVPKNVEQSNLLQPDLWARLWQYVQPFSPLDTWGDWYARFWNLDYFKRDCGHDYWLPVIALERQWVGWVLKKQYSTRYNILAFLFPGSWYIY